MMKVYGPLSLGELIVALGELGDEPVRGLDGLVHSYRGYYERNATTPVGTTHSASVLATLYRGELGKDITGWKGGDYSVKPGELIYYAQEGRTGPAIAALERGEDGVYEVVGVEEFSFW
jgi:hypothetical protein